MNTMDKRVARLEEAKASETPRITEIVHAFYKPSPNGPVFVGETRTPIAPAKPMQGHKA